MTLEHALHHVIEEGIGACRHDYATDDPKREGSIAGFEACRGKTPFELLTILQEACEQTIQAYRAVSEETISIDDYWRTRCFEAEIEWVCNVISAVLMVEGLPIIVSPTARGMMRAAEIVGRCLCTGQDDAPTLHFPHHV